MKTLECDFCTDKINGKYYKIYDEIYCNVCVSESFILVYETPTGERYTDIDNIVEEKYFENKLSCKIIKEYQDR